MYVIRKLSPRKVKQNMFKMLKIFWNVWTRNIQWKYFFFSSFLFPCFLTLLLDKVTNTKHGNKNKLKKNSNWIFLFLVHTFQNILSILSSEHILPNFSGANFPNSSANFANVLIYRVCISLVGKSQDIFKTCIYNFRSYILTSEFIWIINSEG